MPSTPSNPDDCYLIGFGSFITSKRPFEEFSEVEICKLPNFRRLWFKKTIFPYIIPDSSFSGIHVLCFTIKKDRLPHLDKYEGVDTGLYTRVKIEVKNLKEELREAFIYISTDKCIQKCKLQIERDPDDAWLDEIEKNEAVCKKYPELLHHLKP